MKAFLNMSDQSEVLLTALQSTGAKHFLNKISLNTEDFQFFNLSFSISGEDLALRKIFRNKLRSGVPGFYLDIGCADPRLGSNTYLFYCYGWQGICVDANPIVPKLYPRVRPRDIIINAAVSKSGEAFYYGRKKDNEGMSFIAKSIDSFNDEYETPIKVKAKSLVEILDAHAPPDGIIDIMSMDIEGSEMSALQSNDWNKYKPNVIVIETQEYDPLKATTYPTVAYLMKQGYALSMAICGSVIMRNKDASQ